MSAPHRMLATLGLVHYEKLRRRSPAVNSGQTWDQFLVAIIMEQSSRPVDEDLLGGCLLGVGDRVGHSGFVRSFDELALVERGAGPDQSDQVGGVDHPPPGLRGLDQLERHRDPGGAGARALGDPLP